MIKRFIIAFTLLLFVLSATIWAGTSSSRQGSSRKTAGHESKHKGKMELPETKFDFGYIPQSSKVSHVFWVRNIGEDTLEIISVKPG